MMADDLHKTNDNIQRLLEEVRSTVDTVASKITSIYIDNKKNNNDHFNMKTLAKSHLALMRGRNSLIGIDLSDSAWTVLIDLFLHEDKKDISVSSACLASGRPATSALRQIRILCDLGLLERYHAHSDKRIVYLKLNSCARLAVEKFLINLSELIQNSYVGRASSGGHPPHLPSE
jgi:DNA-binding MarR family transcriptional regulator